MTDCFRTFARTVLAIGLVACLTVPGHAVSRLIGYYGKWSTRCQIPTNGRENACIVGQFVKGKAFSGVTMSVAVRFGQNRRDQQLVVIVDANNINLPAGVVLAVDDSKIGRIENYERCSIGKCTARAKISAKWLEALKAGRTASFTIFKTSGKSATISFPLKGFADAVAAVP